MSSHTPGPWEAKRLVDASGESYTTLYQAHIDIGGVCMVWAPDGHLEQEANAKLIALAPEMKAMLERSHDSLKNTLWRLPESGPDYSSATETMAAIRKLLDRTRQ